MEYPSSALFVQYLWRGPLDLILSEADGQTADEIDEWLRTISSPTLAELHRGDWRTRFRQEFPADRDAYLLSFDPYMLDRHRKSDPSDRGNMNLNDVGRIRDAIVNLKSRSGTPVLVQISTYSANNANAQGDVIAAIEPILHVAGLEMACAVRADGSMMSMVFGRDIPGLTEAALDQRFQAWLQQI